MSSKLLMSEPELSAVLDVKIGDTGQSTKAAKGHGCLYRLLAGRRYLELDQMSERLVHVEEVVDNLILPEA
jgi:hypothetical protein